MNVECPKGFLPTHRLNRWHATGQRNWSRRGLRRALLQCDVCGYLFSSARPEALAAAEAIAGPDLEPQPVPQPAALGQRSIPGTRVLQKPMTPVGALIATVDFKERQVGEDDGDD